MLTRIGRTSEISDSNNLASTDNILIIAVKPDWKIGQRDVDFRKLGKIPEDSDKVTINGIQDNKYCVDGLFLHKID